MTRQEFKDTRIRNNLTQEQYAELLWINSRTVQRKESTADKSRIGIQIKKRIEELKKQGVLK